MEKAPTLSVCLITKNEEQFLERCLASVEGVADEIILVDTGSTDSTMEIAKKFNAKIFEIDWPNDFSAARNISLSYASGDWILVIDADEALAQESKHTLISALSGPKDCCYLKRRHYMALAARENVSGGLKETAYGDAYASEQWTKDLRFFPNDKRIKFAGRVHEGIEGSVWGSGIPTRTLEVVLDHFGFLKSEKEKLAKLDSYLALSRAKWSEAPSCWKAGADYADSLLQAGRGPEALAVLASFTESSPSAPEYWFFLGKAQMAVGAHEEAIASLGRAIELGPAYHPAYFALGRALFDIGHFDSSAVCFQEAVRFMPEDPFVLVHLAMTHVGRRDLAAAKKTVEQCLSLVPGFSPALAAQQKIEELESAG